jgi:Uma2 family endonuclease
MGLLINRKKQQVEIYRPDREVQLLQAPQTVLVDVLPGFTLNLRQIGD